MRFIDQTEEWDKLLPAKAKAEMRNRKAITYENGIRILVSEDNTLKWGWLKHVSISRRKRYPTWDEILWAKEYIFGDIDCMMVMPKKEDYINEMKFCFHIWECPEPWGIR